METKVLIKRAFHRYPMVDFYVKSRKMAVSETTNHLCTERLNKVFDELTEKYHIIIHERIIVGLTGHILQEWWNDFIDGKKHSTFNNYVAFLNPFLRWAYNIGYIGDDLSHILHTVPIPTYDTVPEWERPQEKYLTHEEVDRLLHADFPGDYPERNRAIIALFLYSGIRVSELCSLTIDSVTRNGRGYIYCKRKGGRWSNVEVSEAFYPYLEAYLATRSDADDLNAPLFVSHRGCHMDRCGVYRAIAPIQKALGIATGPHALRHTYISEMEKIGGPAIARDLANHKSFRITNRYDHSTRDQRREALRSLDWQPKLSDGGEK